MEWKYGFIFSMINHSDYRLIPHLGRIEGQGDELPARAPLVGVTLQLVMLSCVVRDLITVIKYIYLFDFSWKYLWTDIVGDLDPLAAVLELPVVWGGVVPALGGAVGGEGDGAAGARVDVALDPGHHRVLGTWHSTRAGQWARVTCHVVMWHVVTWPSSHASRVEQQWTIGQQNAMRVSAFGRNR